MNANSPIHIGVIGCGHWGPNHVRNFSTLANSAVVACADPDPERLKAVSRICPGLTAVKDYRELLANPQIEAVVIATPTETHYALCSAALEAGKHVLVEKPLTIKVSDSVALRRLARSLNRVLMVGHTFLFNSGIRKLKECIASGDVGKVFYLHATRTNLGPIRSDVGVVYDLAAHDVSIFNYLLEAQPLEVSARAEKFLRPGIDNVAFISLVYPEHVLASIHVSWLDPKKVRQIVLTGSKKMLSWDDLATTGPVTVYDKGVVAYLEGEQREPYYANYGDFRLLTREGDMLVPYLKLEEPLRAEAAHFLECLRGTPNELSGADCGLAVVKVLAAVQESIASGGRPVKVQGNGEGDAAALGGGA